MLGASGGELPGQWATCLLVDDRLAVDAGALTSQLGIEELLRDNPPVLPPEDAP